MNPGASASRDVVIDDGEWQSLRQQKAKRAQTTKLSHVNDFSQFAAAANGSRRTRSTPPFGIVLTILDSPHRASGSARHVFVTARGRDDGRDRLDSIAPSKSHPHVDKVCAGGD